MSPVPVERPAHFLRPADLMRAKGGVYLVTRIAVSVDQVEIEAIHVIDGVNAGTETLTLALGELVRALNNTPPPPTEPPAPASLTLPSRSPPARAAPPAANPRLFA